MVTYVAADELERGVEVKAVSSHGLTLSSLEVGEVLPGRGEGMPALQGPAWYADVLLDVEVGAPRVDARPHGPGPLASSIPGPHSTHGPR